MERQRFNKIRLFLRLMLLFQIYSHHCFKAEATENHFPETFDERKIAEKTVLNDQIFEDDTGSSVISERGKRPARLLPLKILL